MTTPVIAHAATGHPPPAAGSAAPAVAAQPGDVASPLAGTVVKVEVAVGDKVTQGQPVLVLEAMKMNTSVTAPRDGSVSAIAVTAGTSVGEGQVLMTIA
jgi:biotin carboxyl carrier protein